MDSIANFIGYALILLAAVIACVFILMQALNYLLRQMNVFWRLGFIVGRWQRINYLMEHLPDTYWEDHAHWRKFRLRDYRTTVKESNVKSTARSDGVIGSEGDIGKGGE